MNWISIRGDLPEPKKPVLTTIKARLNDNKDHNLDFGTYNHIIGLEKIIKSFEEEESVSLNEKDFYLRTATKRTKQTNDLLSIIGEAKALLRHYPKTDLKRKLITILSKNINK